MKYHVYAKKFLKEKIIHHKYIKEILITILIAGSVIGVISYAQRPDIQEATTPTNSLSSTTTTMCANAVKDYLAKADTKGKGGDQVKKWHKVTVHYIGRLDDETVFDTSVEEVAKACGKYAAGRDYSQWLSFEVGAGQMIAGFDKGVEWMTIGQTKTIHIEAMEAYGERSEANIIKVPRTQIPNADQLEKWMKVYASNGQPFTVYEVTDKEITLDANHELAGKKLIFDITVQSITN